MEGEEECHLNKAGGLVNGRRQYRGILDTVHDKRYRPIDTITYFLK